MGYPLMNKIYMPKAKKDPNFIYTKWSKNVQFVSTIIR